MQEMKHGIIDEVRGCDAPESLLNMNRNKKNRNSPQKTGLVYHDIFLEHKPIAGHPERPERLIAITQALKKEKWFPELVLLTPKPAPLKWITKIHSSRYLKHVKNACQQGETCLDGEDISLKSYEAAVMSVGGVLAAIDAVMSGKVKNAFCAIRPPGHHALRNRAMGFCIFNNIAIGAKYIQSKYKLKKVLIVDWDVHHGNGTQEIYYDDPTVLYFSIHRYPFYPGTGSEEEKGEGKGFNYTVNVPLPKGSGDNDFKEAFEKKLKPSAIPFNPDFILISAGFDAHEADPLGGMKVSADGYAKLTRIVLDIARECCKGRVVSVLEGGYDLKGLADSVTSHISALK